MTQDGLTASILILMSVHAAYSLVMFTAITKQLFQISERLRWIEEKIFGRVESL